MHLLFLGLVKIGFHHRHQDHPMNPNCNIKQLIARVRNVEINLFSKKEKLASIFLMVVLVLFFLATTTLLRIAVNNFLPGWTFTDLKK